MATKIRLQRHGKKGKPYFHIIIADSRAPRDGKFIERIGSYNPNTNPATIELDHEKAVSWLQSGAVPSDTARAILSYKGAVYYNHLLKGVKKGALTEEKAKAKFEAWQQEKQAKIDAKIAGLANAKSDEAKKIFENEKAQHKAKSAAISAKQSELAQQLQAAQAIVSPPAEVEEVAAAPVEAIAAAVAPEAATPEAAAPEAKTPEAAAPGASEDAAPEKE